MTQRMVLCTLGLSACAVASCSDDHFSPMGDAAGSEDGTTDGINGSGGTVCRPARV